MTASDQIVSKSEDVPSTLEGTDESDPKKSDSSSLDTLDKKYETPQDPDNLHEKTRLLISGPEDDDHKKTSPEQLDREMWTIRAIRVSYVSISLTLVTGITGVLYAFLYDSSAMLGYGCNSFVDVLSSILVVWRFSKTLDPSMINDEAYNRRLEKRAGAGIAMTFVGIAILVGVQASMHIYAAEEPSEDKALLILASCSVLVFTSLASFKLIISIQLASSTMKKDAISSFAVGVLSLGVCISSSVYDITETVWWFDAVVAQITSICLFWYGCRTLFCHSHEWWQPSWWSEDPESVALYQKERELSSNASQKASDCCRESPSC